MRNSLFVLMAFLIASLFFSCAESGDIEAANLLACGSYDSSTHMCDSRDGNMYKITRIPKVSDNVWMAENLKYKQSSSKCYNDDEGNCEIYGRLYAQTDENKENICPPGWRMPSQDDWENIGRAIANAGSDISAEQYKKIYNALKATQYWEPYDGNKSGNGSDTYEFSALPGGAYSIMYLGDNATIDDNGGRICDAKQAELEAYPQWDGSLGKVGVFMMTESAPWVIPNEPYDIRFCTQSTSYVSVRCVKR